MPFELFTRQRPPAVREPAVTIQRQGSISLNRAAYEALDAPEAAELLFDREERLIGIRKVDPSTAHAMPVRPLGRGSSSWLISGRTFTLLYDIPTESARRWIARMDGDLLVVDLKEPGTDVSGVRRGERSDSVS